MNYTLHDDMTQEEALFVRQGLAEFANRFTEPRNYQALGIVLRDANGIASGGISGNTIWDWLRVDVLWVPDALRGKGHGHRLLARAEQLARSRGCNFAMLDTFEFEARDFYEAHGYVVQSQTNNFPAGHTHYHLTKVL